MEIIIFGASDTGKEAYDILLAIGDCSVIMFADNDKKKMGSTFCGAPVVSAGEAAASGYLIIIASGRYIEISRQLDDLGSAYYISIREFILNLNSERRNDLSNSLPQNLSEKFCFNILDDNEVYEDRNKKKYLLIAPLGYGNAYVSGFVIMRARNYLMNGLDVDIFSIGQAAGGIFYDNGIKIYKGDHIDYEYLVKRKKYEKIFIHFVNERIMFHLSRTGKKIPLIIWVHAVETERWSRRIYIHTEEELHEKRDIFERDDKLKLKHLKSIYTNKDYKFIFVSDWIKRVAEEDCDCTVANYEVIHNVIDERVFNYVEKGCEQRKKILIIKSFATKVYANDIMVKAILELSAKKEFSDMEFLICGDGALYDKVMQPLLSRKFPNVKTSRGFKTQEKISEMHKKYGIFLSATRTDSQGVSMGEAMASGLVPVTNNVSAIPEFVDLSCGFLCENENYIQMSEAILFLYNNPADFLRMSKNASKRAVSQCGTNVILPKEIKIIES